VKPKPNDYICLWMYSKAAVV